MAVTKPSAPPKRKKLVFFTLYAFGLAAVFIATAEAALRLKGFEPWHGTAVAVKVEPGGKFYQPHPTLGYTHIPGRYTVFFWDTAFAATHLPNTLRVTQPVESYNDSRTKEEVWIFGCSFTHGWGLQDNETYPWLLQQRMPEYEFVNFGVGGYGSIHSLIQFREALKNKTPRVAVLAYANFHDERNTLARQRRKWVVTGRNLGPIAQPYARLNGPGNLRYSFTAVEYTEFPLMRYSALGNFIEDKYNQLEVGLVHSREVSELLVLEMAKIAGEHKVRFIVAGIFASAGTRKMLQFAQDHGIASVDISVDLKVPENRLPDEHPSAVANRIFADKLESFLKTEALAEARP